MNSIKHVGFNKTTRKKKVLENIPGIPSAADRRGFRLVGFYVHTNVSVTSFYISTNISVASRPLFTARASHKNPTHKSLRCADVCAGNSWASLS